MTTAADANLLHAPDVEHLAFAGKERRVIYTQDADFLRLAATGISHAGIVYSRPGSRSIGEVVSRLALIWEVYGPVDMMDRVEFF